MNNSGSKDPLMVFRALQTILPITFVVFYILIVVDATQIFVWASAIVLSATTLVLISWPCPNRRRPLGLKFIGLIVVAWPFAKRCLHCQHDLGSGRSG